MTEEGAEVTVSIDACPKCGSEYYSEVRIHGRPVERACVCSDCAEHPGDDGEPV